MLVKKGLSVCLYETVGKVIAVSRGLEWEEWADHSEDCIWGWGLPSPHTSSSLLSSRQLSGDRIFYFQKPPTLTSVSLSPFLRPMSYRPISGEGQLECFLMWKEKGHGHEKPSILLFLVLPREAISKQRACAFIYLEELNTFMVCAILALLLKRIFYFSSLPTCNFTFQTAVSRIEGWSGRLWIRITDEQNSWI